MEQQKEMCFVFWEGGQWAQGGEGRRRLFRCATATGCSSAVACCAAERQSHYMRPSSLP